MLTVDDLWKLAEAWHSAAGGCLLSALASLDDPEAAKLLLDRAEECALMSEAFCQELGLL